MKIILIANYTPDRQESMQRFATMLETGFKHKNIATEIWKPLIFFGSFFKSTQTGMGKWFGYMDKWLLFPMILRLRLLKKVYKHPDVRFHICDHSSAPYLKHLPTDKTGITCHDVLAIRGAQGHADAYAKASKTGELYQKWILANLKTAKRLAAVSHFTLNQLKELSALHTPNDKKWVIIHNAFNAPFFPMQMNERGAILRGMGLSLSIPFILHVGTAHPRKNRNFLLHMVKELGDNWQGVVCFAGMPLDSKLTELAKELNLEQRIISAVKPDHKGLVALYSGAEAFVFPSLSEGFGWPVIEAQACGTPVIASSLDPMPEVSGGAAIHAHPMDAKAFADALLKLKNKEVRNNMIENGYNNIQRFQLDTMIESYIKLYEAPILEP